MSRPRDRRCWLRARCSPIAGTATSTARWDRYRSGRWPTGGPRSTPLRLIIRGEPLGVFSIYGDTVAAFDDEAWTATIAPDRHPDHDGQHRDAAQLQRRHPHRPTAGGVAAAATRCAARMDARSPSPNRWCTAACITAQSTRAAPVSCDRHRVVHLHKDPRGTARSGVLQPQHCARTQCQERCLRRRARQWFPMQRPVRCRRDGPVVDRRAARSVAD